MPPSKKHDKLRVRNCCACERTIVTALELAMKKLVNVPPSMHLYAGEFRGRPYCGYCLPAQAKGK
jgi:hypothetical protein